MVTNEEELRIVIENNSMKESQLAWSLSVAIEVK